MIKNKNKLLKIQTLCLLVMSITNTYGYSYKKINSNIQNSNAPVVEEKTRDFYPLA